MIFFMSLVAGRWLLVAGLKLTSHIPIGTSSLHRSSLEKWKTNTLASMKPIAPFMEHVQSFL